MTAQAGSASSFWQRRTALRREMRQVRRAIPIAQRRRAAQQLVEQLQRIGLLLPRMRIGVYLAMPEELELNEVIRTAQHRGCQLFIPRVTSRRARQMQFTTLAAPGRLQRNHYGIAESRDRRRTAPRNLDAVLIPTVAFDNAGHRMGMGAGFYDRHFAFRQRTKWRRPLLIGVAFAQQQVADLPHAPHDVPLDSIVTPIRCFGRHHPQFR